MTGAEWVACDDPNRMLAFLARPSGDPAARWFAAAACRRVEAVASHPAVTEAIALAEEAAEHPVSPERLVAAKDAAFQIHCAADVERAVAAFDDVGPGHANRVACGAATAPNR